MKKSASSRTATLWGQSSRQNGALGSGICHSILPPPPWHLAQKNKNMQRHTVIEKKAATWMKSQDKNRNQRQRKSQRKYGMRPTAALHAECISGVAATIPCLQVSFISLCNDLNLSPRVEVLASNSPASPCCSCTACASPFNALCPCLTTSHRPLQSNSLAWRLSVCLLTVNRSTFVSQRQPMCLQTAYNKQCRLSETYHVFWLHVTSKSACLRHAGTHIIT